MQRRSFEEALGLILQADPRYAKDAYVFLRLALTYTIKSVAKADQGSVRHVTGKELLEGIRQYALQEFGPIARTVLATWGITRTDDFGEIVFNLVNHGVLGKTEQDKKEDFAEVFSFHEAFTRPYLPATRRAAGDKPVKRKRTGLPPRQKKELP